MESQSNQESQVTSFEQVLERMRNTLLEKERNGDLLPTPQHGYTSEDGKSTTLQISQTPQSQLDGNQNQKGLLQKSEVVNLTREEMEQFILAATQLCQIQANYGKTSSSLETIIMGYLQFLPKYSAAELIDALKEWMLNGGRDIATVYDINQILNPKQKPLCPRMYSVIQRRKQRGDYLTANEDRFIKAYEKQQFKNIGGDYA